MSQLLIEHFSFLVICSCYFNNMLLITCSATATFNELLKTINWSCGNTFGWTERIDKETTGQ